MTIHPTAVIGAPPFSFFEDDGRPEPGTFGCEVAADVHVQAGAVVESGTHEPTRIGDGTRIAALVYVGHDSQIGRRVWIAAGARIAGYCTIEDCAYIGAGATIRQHRKVGRGALVGMGAVVTKDVPPNHVVVGNPARFLRLRKREQA